MPEFFRLRMVRRDFSGDAGMLGLWKISGVGGGKTGGGGDHRHFWRHREAVSVEDDLHVPV